MGTILKPFIHIPVPLGISVLAWGLQGMIGETRFIYVDGQN